MENLGDNEQFIKLRHTLSLIGKRIIPGYLFSKYPEKCLMWQYNSCRQTAMFVCWYLTEVVFKDTRSISLYEANFKDPYLGEAVHAFCWVKPTEEDKYGLLIDVSRISYPVLIERMTEMRNPGTILSNKMGYEIEMEDLVEVDWKDMLFSKEYFTEKSFTQFCEEILKLCQLSQAKQAGE